MNCGHSGTAMSTATASGSKFQSDGWCQQRSCPVESRCSLMPARNFRTSSRSWSRENASRSSSIGSPDVAVGIGMPGSFRRRLDCATATPVIPHSCRPRPSVPGRILPHDVWCPVLRRGRLGRGSAHRGPRQLPGRPNAEDFGLADEQFRFARARIDRARAERCRARPRYRCQVSHLARQAAGRSAGASACKMQDQTPRRRD